MRVSRKDSQAFDWSLKLPQRDKAANFDFVQLARDSFVVIAERQEQGLAGSNLSVCTARPPQ